MGNHRTGNPGQKTPISKSRTQATHHSRDADGHPVCPQDRHSLGRFAPGNGLRLRNDLLAAAPGVATGRGLGPDPSDPAEPSARGRPNRLFASVDRFQLRPGGFGGAQTGPNPTDRRKKGTKHHVITDAHGIPLAVSITGANRHDVNQLLPLVDAIPPIAGKVGRPRKRPDKLQGDRAYDSQAHRQALRQRGIEPVLAKRWTPHGSGLGEYRWPVERSLSWLHQNRRLRVRYDKSPDIHQAFLILACIKICWNHLAHSSFC